MKLRLLCSVSLGLVLAGAVAAQTKVSGTAQCAKPDPAYSIEVGDHPGHMMGLQKDACTWTTPLEIAGTKSKDGFDVTTLDTSMTHSSATGTHTSTMENGDKFYVSFHANTTVKDGKPVSDTGTWHFISGTGKLKGIKGGGTFKTTYSDDGSYTVQVEGSYDLAGAK